MKKGLTAALRKKIVKLRSNRDFVVAVIIIATTALLIGVVSGVGMYKAKDKIGSSLQQIENKISNVEEQSATIDVVKKVSPSVVSITTEQSRMDFFGYVQNSKSTGTGFIVSSDGLIVTNKHVVSATGASYAVFTSEGKEYAAKVVAVDPSFDIAFIKIDGKNLPVAELGDSDNIQVGQKAIAFGNALGQYQNTVTSGIISAVGRAIDAGSETSLGTERLENMIQTDAAINPGNSGGPLVNIAGQVIGINTAVDAQAQGIGFAIPINLARSALLSVQEKGKITRPIIGVRYINITKEFAARNNLEVDRGALIYAGEGDLAVLPNSPASRAGLKEGDIIIRIGRDVLGEGKSLVGVLSRYQPGDRVQILFLREGRERTTEVTLGESK